MANLKFPEDLLYAESDEWLRIEGTTAIIGISDYAQDALNDIVYVELPSLGTVLTKGETFGSVESVKAASELYAMVSGEVIEVNTQLENDPELINTDPYGAGWIMKLKLTGSADTAGLLDAASYATYCADR